MKKLLLCSLLSILPILTSCSDSPKLAIKGYDPVAYFTKHKATKGIKDINYTHENRIYRFSSVEHMNLFSENSTKYAPQYDGNCAYAVALKSRIDADPTYWRIVKNKLYLNLNEHVQKRWAKDIPGYIEKADRNWPGLRRD